MAILPEYYHRLDRAWIKNKLINLPQAMQLKVCKRYTEVYEEAHKSEPISHKKDGAARYAANSRLRKFVENL